MANNNRGCGDIVMDSGEFMSDEGEEDFGTGTFSEGDSLFDTTIGHIEDIIMDEEFQTMQSDFLEKYYTEFEDTEENKFIYTDIHQEYIDLIEKYLENQLQERMEDFSMETFQAQLIERKEELEGEIFEMLLTFSDFMAFKELVLDYRGDKEGNNIDFSEGLVVTSLAPAAENGLCVCGPSSLGSAGLCVGAAPVGSADLAIGSVSDKPSVSSPTIAPCSFLTPMPSKEPDMSRLQVSQKKERVEAAMSMSPGQSLEEGDARH